MKKRGIDAAMEIDLLLEDYNSYSDAQIGFLLKQMIRENDRRQYEYKKKVDQIRRDFREGKGVFADKRKKQRKFSGGIKAPWEIKENKRQAEREQRLYNKENPDDVSTDAEPDSGATDTDSDTESTTTETEQNNE